MPEKPMKNTKYAALAFGPETKFIITYNRCKGE
jgi:hypothetical protein